MLVGEVEDLRKMMESLKRMVTGQGLEEKRGETGDQEASLEEAEEKEKEKSVGEKTRENSSTDNKDGKRIRPGAQMIATHDYKKNPESPVGNELDVNEGDTLVYLMTNENNEHWWLAEDGKGQVGYVPATYLKIIRDVTRQEEESDTAGKEGYGKKTDGSKIGGDMGQDGERRKTYSEAVIEGFKRNSAIYVGDSIVRKTDSRLNKGEDVVVCLPGARIEHVTARVEKIMGRGKGGTILVHIGTNNADKEGTTAIVDKYSKLLKKTKEARVGQIILSGILPVFGNRIDGYRNSKRMAINGMVKRLCKEEDVGYVDLWDSFVMGKRGGGVLLYIKETIPAYEVQLHEEADCNEAIWCKLVTGHTTVTIGVVYRCPNITKENNEKIHNAISEVSKGDCIIMGDFNHGNIRWDTLQSTGVEDQKFVCRVQDNFLTQHVLEPTRATRILDIVLSSQKELVDNVEIKEPLGSSDHNQMHFNINVKSDKTKVKQCRRDFRKGNYKEIRKRLTLIDWNGKMKNKTAAECSNIVRGELDNAIDSYVPMKKQGKWSKKKHLSKEAFRKIDINKICGGFINIRERIQIMMLTKRH